MFYLIRSLYINIRQKILLKLVIQVLSKDGLYQLDSSIIHLCAVYTIAAADSTLATICATPGGVSTKQGNQGLYLRTTNGTHSTATDASCRQAYGHIAFASYHNRRSLLVQPNEKGVTLDILVKDTNEGSNVSFTALPVLKCSVVIRIF